jgi:ubiquinone biosynthesis protein COQ4
LFNRWPGYTFADLAAIQDSVDGWAFHQIAERMRGSRAGRRLLRERPEITVAAVEALQHLPEGSLGRAFWYHMASNDILEMPDLGVPSLPWDEDTQYARDRYRQTHDVRHTLLGVGIEGHEEVILQTFQFAQQPQFLSAGIVLLGGLKHALLDGKWRLLLRKVPQAWRAGKVAVDLSSVHFESLWHLPLEDARRALNLTPICGAAPTRTAPAVA